MELKEGMYVKYTRGGINGYVPPRIGKIIERLNDSEFLKLDTNCTILENDVSKASHNIIDLIEVGDYVNGKYVYGTGYNTYDDFGVKIEKDLKYSQVIKEHEIESIVTKEQFKSIEYMLGDK